MTKDKVLAKCAQLTGRVGTSSRSSDKPLASSSTTSPLNMSKLLDDPNNIADNLRSSHGRVVAATARATHGPQIYTATGVRSIEPTQSKFAGADCHSGKSFGSTSAVRALPPMTRWRVIDHLLQRIWVAVRMVRNVIESSKRWNAQSRPKARVVSSQAPPPVKKTVYVPSGTPFTVCFLFLRT